MNYEPILAVLPDSKEDAKSMREIAQAMGLDISSHASWIREQRMLARVLRILIKWGWAAWDCQSAMVRVKSYLSPICHQSLNNKNDNSNSYISKGEGVTDIIKRYKRET